MPIAFDNATGINTSIAGSKTVSVSYTVGSGANRLLLVFISCNSATDLFTGVSGEGVKYNGVAMTRVAFYPNGGHGMYAYALAAPATGTHNIVLLSNTVYFSFAMGGWSCEQAKQVVPSTFVTHTATPSGGVDCTATLTTPSASCWLVLNAADNIGGTIGAGTGITMRANGGGVGFGTGDSATGLATGSHSLATTEVSSVQQWQAMLAIEPDAVLTPVPRRHGSAVIA